MVEVLAKKFGGLPSIDSIAYGSWVHQQISIEVAPGAELVAQLNSSRGDLQFTPNSALYGDALTLSATSPFNPLVVRDALKLAWHAPFPPFSLRIPDSPVDTVINTLRPLIESGVLPKDLTLSGKGHKDKILPPPPATTWLHMQGFPRGYGRSDVEKTACHLAPSIKGIKVSLEQGEMTVKIQVEEEAAKALLDLKIKIGNSPRLLSISKTRDDPPPKSFPTSEGDILALWKSIPLSGLAVLMEAPPPENGVKSKKVPLNGDEEKLFAEMLQNPPNAHKNGFIR